MNTPATSVADYGARAVGPIILLGAPGAGPHGTDISRPAEFLIDSSGTVRWMNLTDNIGVRARPEEVLKAFDESIGAVTSQ